MIGLASDKYVVQTTIKTKPFVIRKIFTIFLWKLLLLLLKYFRIALRLEQLSILPFLKYI